MKPYGRIRKLKHFKGKIDYHPQKGYINWWECIINTRSRTSIKNAVLKDIEDDLYEFTNH